MEIVEFADEHFPFVRDSFVQGVKPVFPYSDLSKETITAILARKLYSSWARGVVAVLEGVIVGWAVSYKGRLFYAHVKHEYRRSGIARAMTEALELSPRTPVMVWTPSCRKIVRDKPGRVFPLMDVYKIGGGRAQGAGREKT